MMGAKEFHAERVLADRGSNWLIMEMQLKPYSACRWNHAAIDALGALAPEFEPSEVKQIDVYTFQSAVDACSKTDPNNTFELSFSIPTASACCWRAIRSCSCTRRASRTKPSSSFPDS